MELIVRSDEYRQISITNERPYKFWAASKKERTSSSSRCSAASAVRPKVVGDGQRKETNHPSRNQRKNRRPQTAKASVLGLRRWKQSNSDFFVLGGGGGGSGGEVGVLP